MPSPLPASAKAKLDDKLSSSWFYTVQGDILAKHDPILVQKVGENLLVDMLRAEPQLPFVRDMIASSPGIEGRVAAAIDGRKCDPEQMFKFFGEAAVVANVLDMQIESDI